MCRFKKICFSLLAFLFMASDGKAASSMCEAKEIAELNREVVNIKGSFEEAEGELNPSEFPIPDEILGTEAEADYVGKYNYFKVSIINISENFYVEISNDYNRDKLVYQYKDTQDGVITFDWKNLDKVTTFTVKVYSSDQTNCPDELYRTITISLPRYNEFYDYTLCERASDYYLCEKYVDYGEVDFGTFVSNITRHIEQKEKEEEEEAKKEDFVSKHKTILIINGVIVVVITGVVVAVIIKKRRSSDNV